MIHQLSETEIAVKLSPAVDLRQLDAYGGQVEFISVNGDLKEAILWTHRSPSTPFATLITDSIHHFHNHSSESAIISDPKQWFFEPDPSILRAGLVQNLAVELNATMLDETIAYLTLDEQIATPWIYEE